MLLCSGAMQIRGIVYPKRFRFICSSWGGVGAQVPGGERLKHSLVVPFSPLSLLLYFSHSHYSLWGFLVELSTILSQEEKIVVDKCMLSGTKNNRNNLLNLLWKQRILPIECNLWQFKKQELLAKFIRPVFFLWALCLFHC